MRVLVMVVAVMIVVFLAGCRTETPEATRPAAPALEPQSEPVFVSMRLLPNGGGKVRVGYLPGTPDKPYAQIEHPNGKQDVLTFGNTASGRLEQIEFGAESQAIIVFGENTKVFVFSRDSLEQPAKELGNAVGNTVSLPAQYSLVVNGKTIDLKKVIKTPRAGP